MRDVKQIVSIFSNDLSNLEDQLETAVEESDMQKVREVAHTIKGAAANIRASRLSQVAAKLESAALQGDVGSVNKLVLELRSSKGALCDGFADFLDNA